MYTKKLAKSWQNDYENVEKSVIHTLEKPHCLPTKSDTQW